MYCAPVYVVPIYLADGCASYEEFARLAETRLAQSSLNYP